MFNFSQHKLLNLGRVQFSVWEKFRANLSRADCGRFILNRLALCYRSRGQEGRNDCSNRACLQPHVCGTRVLSCIYDDGASIWHMPNSEGPRVVYRTGGHLSLLGIVMGCFFLLHNYSGIDSAPWSSITSTWIE